jgi:hypothetical protein
MYELRGNQPMAEKCIELDYEAEIKNQRDEFRIIDDFGRSLKDFIMLVGRSYTRNDRDFLSELFGTVIIDLMQRQKTIDSLIERLEEK